MIHAPHYPKNSDLSLKQVELNTISAAFPILSGIITNLHRHLTERMDVLKNIYDSSRIPINDNRVALGISRAWELYDNKESVITMIVHPNETNTFDQRMLEFKLWENFKIKVIRRSLADFAERGSIDPKSFELWIDGLVVSVVYYRAGYDPSDYPSQKEWDGRLLIERSLAIKCPNISYHLTGTKKIQQVLANQGVLEQYFSDPKIISKIRNSFMGLYSLTEGEVNVAEISQKAINNPEDYVMKPQREGGGHLITKQEMKEALMKFTPQQKSAYILMDRILPPVLPSVMVREGKLIETTAVSELGIYSVFVSDGTNIITNEYAGYLLRTKVSDKDDGGVSAGVAVLDSLYLI